MNIQDIVDREVSNYLGASMRDEDPKWYNATVVGEELVQLSKASSISKNKIFVLSGIISPP